jgi:hypothetical protein
VLRPAPKKLVCGRQWDKYFFYATLCVSVFRKISIIRRERFAKNNIEKKNEILCSVYGKKIRWRYRVVKSRRNHCMRPSTRDLFVVFSTRIRHYKTMYSHRLGIYVNVCAISYNIVKWLGQAAPKKQVTFEDFVPPIKNAVIST